MKSDDIIRAWKDEAYRDSLSTDEQALLPEHPAGLIELTDHELAGVAGGEGATEGFLSLGCCDGPTIGAGTCAIEILSIGCCWYPE